MVYNIGQRLFKVCWYGWICNADDHPSLQASLFSGCAWKLSSASTSIQQGQEI